MSFVVLVQQTSKFSRFVIRETAGVVLGTDAATVLLLLFAEVLISPRGVRGRERVPDGIFA